jgi:hypothetical protein
VKTQLIYLDSNDDHASARDKLNWARADRIVLVWPAHGRILTRRLDLQLLLRAARAQGGKLGLVTHDPDVRFNAVDLGLPVFDTPDRLPESAWSRAVESSAPEFKPPRLPRPLTAGPHRRIRDSRGSRVERVLLALLPPVALLALAATVVPAAVIELEPLATTQEGGFEIRLAWEGGETPATGSVPARRIVTSVEGDLRQPTTGQVLVPSAAASGRVTFANLTAQPVDIPAGTGLQTNGGIRFETRAAARLEPGPGSQASVAVEAAAEGESGNVAADAIAAVEGALGLEVTVVNPDPTTGGADSERAGVSAADVQRSREALTRRLIQEARIAAEAQLQPGEALAPDSVRVVTIEASRFSPSIGNPGDSVELYLALAVEALLVQEADLVSYATRLLESQSPGAFAVVPGSTQVELLASASTPGDPYSYAATARRDIYRPIDLASVHRLVRGRPRAEAAALLDDRLDLARPPRIHVWPAWLPWLPLLPVRTEVHFGWATS